MTSKLTQLAEEKSSLKLQTMSRKAITWLQGKVDELNNVYRIPPKIGSERDRFVRSVALGKMYFFYYDPKTKETIDYYDKFPLVIILEKYPDGFLGLNLHYLPIPYRIKFLKALLPLASLDDNDDIKRVRITYELLSEARRFSAFKPCLKRYLYSHLRSKILIVKPNEWDVAAMLPVHQFRKAKAKTVWQDSVNEIKQTS
jgi:hypothetical protein